VRLPVITGCGTRRVKIGRIRTARHAAGRLDRGLPDLGTSGTGARTRGSTKSPIPGSALMIAYRPLVGKRSLPRVSDRLSIDGCSRIAAPGAPGRWPGVAARARQEAPPARRDRRGHQDRGPRLRPPGRDRIEPRPK
jgi:hypothetical protein